MYFSIGSDLRFQASTAHDFAREVPPGALRSAGGNTSSIFLNQGTMDLRHPGPVGANADSFEVQRPHGMPPRPIGFPTSVDYPPMAISRIANAAVAPGGIAFTENATRLLSESLSAYWEPQPHSSIMMPSPGVFQLMKPISFDRFLPGQYFYLDSQHIGHFGHLMLDNFTRLWGYLLLKEYLGFRDLKIITRPLLHEVRRGLLAIGVCAEDIYELNEPVICEELVVARKALQIQDYTTPIIAPLFARMRDGLKQPVAGPRRMFISRQNSPLRPLINENAVQEIFQKRGFEVRLPSDFGSFEGQVSAFAQAEYLAGPSGSNMYCAAFNERLKGSFIMSSPSLVHYAESFLQEGSRCRAAVYVGSIDPGKPSCNPLQVNSPWEISDLDDLERSVDGWLQAADSL